MHHSKQILVWLGERDQLQLLIEPSVLVRMNDMEGDCAIYSMLICSMLECLGIDWELQTLATNPGQPDIYNHVFLRVVLPNGRRIPFDCSHGKYPGWRVPENNVLRSQVWDESGAAVPDAAEYQGLGSYVQNPNPWWFTGNAGLGQDTTDTTDTTLPPIDTLPSGSTLSDLTGTLPPMGPTVIDTSTGSSVSLDSLATSIGVDPSLLNQTSYNSSTGLVTTSRRGARRAVSILGGLGGVRYCDDESRRPVGHNRNDPTRYGHSPQRHDCFGPGWPVVTEHVRESVFEHGRGGELHADDHARCCGSAGVLHDRRTAVR